MVSTRTGKKTDGATTKAPTKPSSRAASKKATGDRPTDTAAKHSIENVSQAVSTDGANIENTPEPKKRKVDKEDGNEDAHEILEKGNIYFFYRARVGVEQPKCAADIARSFLVLRPDKSEKKNCRLIAIPKKKLPRSGHDRHMAILLNAHFLYDELHSFLGDDAKEEESSKVSVSFGEGVYALVSTAGGRESHLVYSLTVPAELGQVQHELGLDSKRGCWITSTKNPEYSMPIGAKMVHGGPEYPDRIKAEFEGRRWAPLQPDHLAYDNSHLLLIGESHGADKILSEQDVAEELEELADADLNRMHRLGSTEAEAVFASLGIEHVQPKQELVKTFE